jgi:hypothetical protein
MLINQKIERKIGRKAMLELLELIEKFPPDRIITFRGRPVGRIIGYEREHGYGDYIVVFKYFNHISAGLVAQFSSRTKDYALYKANDAKHHARDLKRKTKNASQTQKL